MRSTCISIAAIVLFALALLTSSGMAQQVRPDDVEANLMGAYYSVDGIAGRNYQPGSQVVCAFKYTLPTRKDYFIKSAQSRTLFPGRPGGGEVAGQSSSGFTPGGPTSEGRSMWIPADDTPDWCVLENSESISLKNEIQRQLPTLGKSNFPDFELVFLARAVLFVKRGAKLPSSADGRYELLPSVRVDFMV